MNFIAAVRLNFRLMCRLCVFGSSRKKYAEEP